MKYILKVFFLIAGFIAICSFSSEAYADAKEPSAGLDWLKIYYEAGGKRHVFRTHVEEVDSIRFAGDSSDTSNLSDIPATRLFMVCKDSTTLEWGLDTVRYLGLGGRIPRLYIDTDEEVEEIPDKENYLSATFRYIPFDGTDSIHAPVSIRGRGNSSWFFPKKPYRLKFDKKQQPGDLVKAKSFVLISNYIDNTLMRNAVAFKVANILGLPFTNISQPVDLVFNGEERGSYMLTNKVGINSGSVDIDEKEGILWEMDTNYDEEFRFMSEPFGLPCMVKDPDFREIADTEEEVEEIWNFWKEDLNSAMKAVEEGRWDEAFDSEQFVNYILANVILHNCEIGYPKSVFLYKEDREGKYKMGPVWDFDWAMGYTVDIRYNMIFRNSGAFPFLNPIIENPKFREMFAAALDDFCENHLQEVLDYIDEYADTIRDSAIDNALIWPAEHYIPDAEHDREINTSKFDENVEWLKDWLVSRVEFVKNHPNYGFY